MTDSRYKAAAVYAARTGRSPQGPSGPRCWLARSRAASDCHPGRHSGSGSQRLTSTHVSSRNLFISRTSASVRSATPNDQPFQARDDTRSDYPPDPGGAWPAVGALVTRTTAVHAPPMSAYKETLRRGDMVVTICHTGMLLILVREVGACQRSSRAERVLLHISTCTKAQLAALPAGGGRHPFPLPQLVTQVTSDRLLLAGEHLRAGDQLIFALQFRSAISRHYYAMYHAARAIVFADVGGDDHQSHSVLPRNLPQKLPDIARREQELVDARLLRNEADYDIYPPTASDWESDARGLAVIAAEFVQVFEDFALASGYV